MRLMVYAYFFTSFDITAEFLIMPELIPVFTKDEIKSMVLSIAEKISSDYQSGEIILIGVLKGAFIFLSDLIRHLTIPVAIDFVGTSSYESGTSSSGDIRLTKEVSVDLKHKDVIIVEDIVDTGLTLTYLIDYIKSFGPRSVKICALIDKQERREADIRIDYPCYSINKGFLVGYGLDFNENYRGLSGIYQLKF